MKILCTFPGKYGDIMWALPTLRALSQSLDNEPIDLLIAGAYRGLVPLLERQSYLRNVEADPDWIVQDTAPMTPRIPTHRWWGCTPQVFHLGYRGWPEQPLPYETYACLLAQWPTDWPTLRPLDLDRPWITVTPAPEIPPVILGWTDEHFELKVGLSSLLLVGPLALDPAGSLQLLNISWGPRWQAEWWAPTWGSAPPPGFGNWRDVARMIAGAKVFCGDCSALHVLACAVGTPVVMVEPNPHRHQAIFYPYGTEGRVRLVRGVDGLPTFDARHTWDVIQKVLESAQ